MQACPLARAPHQVLQCCSHCNMSRAHALYYQAKAPYGPQA